MCLNLTSFGDYSDKNFEENFFFLMKTSSFGKTLIVEIKVFRPDNILIGWFEMNIIYYECGSAMNALVYCNFCGGT